MRFDRNLETRDGVRLCILSVVLIAVVGSFLFVVSRVVESSAGGHAAVERHMDRADQAGIEESHRKDVAATLASDPKLLAELWTDDAVRLQPGGPAEVGLTVIPRERPKAACGAPPGQGPFVPARDQGCADRG